MEISEQTSTWQTVKDDLRDLFPSDVYQTWFAPIEAAEENDTSVTLAVPSEFAAIWIQDNYHELILNRLQMATGRSMELKIEVSARAAPAPEPTPAPKPAAAVKKAPRATSYVLNPRNTFSNFVVGSGNQLAHAACIAVANAPARAYNPLFLYGDTGLGKTHLMHAVAHQVLASNPEAVVAYISTEKFTNEFIHAIQNNTLIQFRKRYRSVDILLIDDIHFLSGKERIQEEFFHTFNDLFESQKQILLTSDRPISEIAKLEARLVSRFQWGLVSDIQIPDYETRLAIITKKAEALDLHLAGDILEFLAKRVARNVRRLEGALTRVAGYAELVNGRVDVPAVENLLKDILQEEAQNRVTVEKIQHKVTEHYHLRPSDMQSKRRPAHIAFPRQIAMYLARTLTRASLQDIGEAFGGRDHGTVIYACKTVENMIDQDESVKRNVEFLQTQLSRA